MIRPRDAASYILVITRNVLRTALRRRAARKVLPMLFDAPAGQAEAVSPEDAQMAVEWRDVEDAVVAACDALPSATLRAVAHALLVEDRDHEQVAVELGITIVTLRKRLSRAREYLRTDAKLLLLVADAKGKSQGRSAQSSSTSGARAANGAGPRDVPPRQSPNGEAHTGSP